jgi:hypothetical protein
MSSSDRQFTYARHVMCSWASPNVMRPDASTMMTPLISLNCQPVSSLRSYLWEFACAEQIGRPPHSAGIPSRASMDSIFT